MGVKSALIGNSFIDSSSDLSLTGLSEFIYGVHFISNKSTFVKKYKCQNQYNHTVQNTIVQ